MRLPAADCGALAAPARSRARPDATDVDEILRSTVVVRRGSEPARHQRLHAASHGRRRAQRDGGSDPPRPRRRSGLGRASTSVRRRFRWRRRPACGPCVDARAKDARSRSAPPSGPDCARGRARRGRAGASATRYLMRLRMWLENGEPVRWPSTSGPGRAMLDRRGDDACRRTADQSRLAHQRGVLRRRRHASRRNWRRLEIAPHLAYGERGVPGVIPPGARLTAEITVLEGPRQDRRT